MKKYVIATIIFSVIKIQGIAQEARDALMFSRYYAGSTARSTAMGGAFGALGGDVSVLSTNPAGLALFRSSEFTFSPTLNIAATQAKFDGRLFPRSSNTRFILNNIGYVHTKEYQRERGLMSLNFGMAYNRLSDFNFATRVSTVSATSSLLDEFVLFANVDDWSEHYEGIAENTFVLFKPDEYGDYINDFMLEDRYGQLQSRRISSRGGVGEYAFSLGFNINHNIYLGATLGIQDISYNEYSLHEEITPNDFIYLQRFTFTDDYTVSGLGLNFKSGVIYRPISMLRVGAALHTPTKIWLRPDHYTRMETVWNESPYEGQKAFWDDASTDPFDEDRKFQLRTPWRYMFSAAAIVGTFGAVSAEVEIIDYTENYITPQLFHSGANKDIVQYHKTVANIKTGAEYRLGSLSFRGGFALFANPYKKLPDVPAEIGTLSYSGGIGFRTREFYLDAAYSFTKHPERMHHLYQHFHGDANTNLQTDAHKAILTFGFRF